MKHLSAVLRSLPQWFTHQRLATKATVQTDDHLTEIPAGLAQALATQLQSLPAPRSYQETIQLKTREALQTWRANPETASNSLTVLGPPVEAIAALIKDSLQTYLLDCDVQFALGGYQRPPNPLDITGHIQRELQPHESGEASPSAPVTQTEIHDAVSIVRVVPHLEPCFLRCIQGWAGVEYLQTLTTQDPSRFWVFGCNHWAWVFLDKVCQINAYLETTINLPELSGEDLATWLRPLLETTVERSTGQAFDVHISDSGTAYWNALASAASGNAATAARLWLRSLRLESDLLTPDGTLPNTVTTVELATTQPSLPSLMTLDAMDRYLLHSLMIHGSMTRSHLALSLGEDERTIRSRVQVLRREGIILQSGRRLTVQPSHYPKLYRELGNNNFLIGEA